MFPKQPASQASPGQNRRRAGFPVKCFLLFLCQICLIFIDSKFSHISHLRFCYDCFHAVLIWMWIKLFCFLYLYVFLSAVPGPTWETDHCGKWGELVAKTTFAFIDQHHVGCVIIQTDAKSSCFGTSGQENQKTKCEGVRRKTTFSKRTQHWGVGCRNVEIPHVWNKPAQKTNKQQQKKKYNIIWKCVFYFTYV